ncbi:DUF7536 family protein [Haloarchaeobius sp. HRN-SO-5]|uniref:DUF7536 family protein n=1 Tax=Haloarchaeobius sp. HRN-SO-5 TaxID=3446118 RepID=UPI003EB6ED43
MSDTTEPVDEQAPVDDSEPVEAPHSADHRPGRPPLVRFFEALGVRRHARVGALSGLLLAVALFTFFVVLPSVVPGVRGRTESTFLFLVLGFVVAVTTALFVTTVLTVRTLFQQVASPPKWVRRGGIVATLGGVAWAGATVAGVVVGDPLRPWLSVPVLLTIPGIWAVHTRVKRLDRDLDRVGTVVAVAGAVAVHGAAILDPDPFLGGTVAPVLTPFTASVGTLAAGTLALSLAASDELGAPALVAVVLSGGALAALGSGLAGVVAVSGAVAVVPLALGWVALGVGLWQSPRPAGWTPGESPSLFDDSG